MKVYELMFGQQIQSHMCPFEVYFHLWYIYQVILQLYLHSIERQHCIQRTLLHNPNLL